MGNFILGWNNNNVMTSLSKEKIVTFSKDKLFSHSSIASSASMELLRIEDQNVQPFNEQRFRQMKKTKKNTKKNVKRVKKNRR